MNINIKFLENEKPNFQFEIKAQVIKYKKEIIKVSNKEQKNIINKYYKE